MAITFEGTCGRGPDGVTWNTEADYLDCGRDMGLALFDQLGLAISASTSTYGAPCASAQLSASLAQQPDLSHTMVLVTSLGPANGLGVLVVGGAQVQVPFPSPWANCTLLAQPDATLGVFLSGFGTNITQVPVPAVPGLVAFTQVVTLDASLSLDATNGVRVQNDY